MSVVLLLLLLLMMNMSLFGLIVRLIGLMLNICLLCLWKYVCVMLCSVMVLVGGMLGVLVVGGIVCSVLNLVIMFLICVSDMCVVLMVGRLFSRLLSGISMNRNMMM